MAGWNSTKKKQSGRLQSIKRGFASLFVCLLVLLPLYLAVMTAKRIFF